MMNMQPIGFVASPELRDAIHRMWLKAWGATPEQLREIDELEARLERTQIDDLRRAVALRFDNMPISHANSYISAMRVYLGDRSRAKSAGRRAAAVVRIWEQTRKQAELKPKEDAERKSESLWSPAVGDDCYLGIKPARVAAVRPGFVRLQGAGIPTGWIALEKVRPE